MILNRCDECGGFYYGSTGETTGDFICTCIVPYKTDDNLIAVGWICPRCGKVYSPYTCNCVDCGKPDTTLLWDPVFADYTNDIIWDNIL